jgi:hypothetical protein
MLINIDWFDINGEDDGLTPSQGVGFDQPADTFEEAISQLMIAEEIPSNAIIKNTQDGYIVVTTGRSLGVVSTPDHPVAEEIAKMRKTLERFAKLGNL